MTTPVRLVKRTTEAQRRAKKKYAERHKAEGICVSCTRDATNGVHCDDHAARNRARSLVGRGDRVPTFEDFERLVPE